MDMRMMNRNTSTYMNVFRNNNKNNDEIRIRNEQ